MLCVLTLSEMWFRAGGLKRDITEPELRMILILIFISMVSLLYAANTGVVIKLLQTEIIYSLGLIIGSMVAIKTKKDLVSILNLIACLSVLVSVQVIQNGGTGPSLLGDENDVTVSVLVLFPFVYYGAFFQVGYMKWVCRAGVLLSVGAVVVAGSRGGFLGFVAALGMIYLNSNRKVLLFFAGMAAICIAVAFLISDDYIEDMSTMQNTETGTADERLYSWGLGVEMFLDNPILGVGAGQYGWVVYHYQEERGDLDGAVHRLHLGGRSSHSTYIDYLSERGIVGLVLMFFLIRSIYRRIKTLGREKFNVSPVFEDNSLRYFYLAISTAIPGYLVCSVFVTTFYYPNMWLIIGLVVAVYRLLEIEQGTTNVE